MNFEVFPKLKFLGLIKVSTYKVERTSITVRLTWTTMVTYWSVKLLIIWLRNISMQVGRVT